MERTEVIALMSGVEREKAHRKIGYWQAAGTAILENDELSEKWCAFVERQANDEFARGALLDETLQVLTMIKANVPSELIAETIKQIPSGQTIVDAYLDPFVHPEIISGIKSHVSSRQI